MQVFRKFATFFCVFGVVQSIDFNFWLGKPTNVEIPEIKNNRQNPIQLYTCMANLLCQLGKDAPTLLKACENLVDSDGKTAQNGGWPFWKLTDFENYGKVDEKCGNLNYGNTGNNYGNWKNCIPNWNPSATSAPKVQDNQEFEEARQELCKMTLRSQYYYIRDKYTEAMTLYLNSTDESQYYPTLNCTVSLMFDLSVKDKCGERWLYPINPLHGGFYDRNSKDY